MSFISSKKIVNKTFVRARISVEMFRINSMPPHSSPLPLPLQTETQHLLAINNATACVMATRRLSMLTKTNYAAIEKLLNYAYAAWAGKRV